MQREVVRTAAALIIGNELLSGKTREENLAPLAKTLRSLGVRLSRTVVVEDDLETIAGEVAALHRAYDVVFTSGGVGPTHDDVTLQGVADGFGVPLEPHPHLVSLLHAVYGERCTDEHLLMARAPAGAELVSSSEIKWPVVVMHNVWVLPGVPELFRMKLSVARDHLRGPAPIVSRELFTHLEEPELKPLLDRVVAEHATVEIGSYPKWFDPTYKTKVTFDGRDVPAVEAAHAALLALLPEAAVARRA